MSETKIPKHRHQVNLRSGDLQKIEPGKRPRAKKPRKPRVKAAAAPTSVAARTDGAAS
jgi:hypothetical protein